MAAVKKKKTTRTTKRTTSRRTARKKKKTTGSFFSSRLFWGLILLSFFVFSITALCYVLFFRTVRIEPHAHKVVVEKKQETADILQPVKRDRNKESLVKSSGPSYTEQDLKEEVIPKEKAVVIAEPKKKVVADSVDTDKKQIVAEQKKSNLPVVSIIIDDMGFHPTRDRAFLALPHDLTFSFLPYAPHTAELERLAYQQGKTVLLHLPMQPKSGEWDPGLGALLVGQEWGLQKKIINADLRKVPHAVGVNNHMGSLYTEQKTEMERVLSYLDAKGLFFVDSVTSGKSVGYSIARAMGMKTAKRNVFLDNKKSKELICRQIEQLVQHAEKTGKSVGICHPYPETYKALKQCLPLYKRRVQIVGVSSQLSSQLR